MFVSVAQDEWRASEALVNTSAGRVNRAPASIDPILQKHGVPLCLNGHDHDPQHVRRGATDYSPSSWRPAHSAPVGPGLAMSDCAK